MLMTEQQFRDMCELAGVPEDEIDRMVAENTTSDDAFTEAWDNWLKEKAEEEEERLDLSGRRPKLSDPCPAEGRNGRHSLYANAGPGGKRHRVKGWTCCDKCGANGPMDSVIYAGK